MKGDDLLNSMELVNPAYVEAADAPVVRTLRRARWSLLAACALLLAAAVTAVAASGLGTKLIESFTARTAPGSDLSESGYTLSVETARVPQTALRGDIAEVPALIRAQFEKYQPFMSQYPGCFAREFDTRAAACDYVGYDGLKRVEFEPCEGPTLLSVNGEQDGSILSVTLETDCAVGQIRLQFFSTIYTDKAPADMTTGAVTTEYAEFTETYHTTSKGAVLHVIEQTALQSGFAGMDGYLADAGVLYDLHIAYTEQDAARARELMLQWAELF